MRSGHNKINRLFWRNNASRILTILVVFVFLLTFLIMALPAKTLNTDSSENDESLPSASPIGLSSRILLEQNHGSASAQFPVKINSVEGEKDAQRAASGAADSGDAPGTNKSVEKGTNGYSRSAEIRDSGGILKVSASSAEGVLPEDAELVVRPITSGDGESGETYRQVAAKIRENAVTQHRRLTGFLAYDISFLSNGKEVEPGGNVNVTMDWSRAAAPGGVSGSDEVSLLHFMETKGDAVNQADVVDLTSGRRSDKNNIASIDTNSKKQVKGAEITVDRFSVFTITWTKGGTDSDKDSRVAEVNLHYVDEEGDELDDPVFTSAASIASDGNNGIASVADWANMTENNESVSRIFGYTFKEARLSDAKSGTMITGMMATGTVDPNNSTRTVYSLKYTSASTVPEVKTDKNWTAVPPDDITGANNNQVNVYLVYEQQPHITIHHVNEAGKKVADSEVKYASELPSEISDLSSWAKSDAGYKEHSYAYKGADGAHLTSTIGIPVSAVKAEKSGKEYIVRYRISPGGEWKTAETKKNNIDLYLLYDRSDPDAKTVTIHYVEKNGDPITDETGKALTKVVYPDEWDSRDYDSRESNNGEGVIGSYTTYVDMIRYAASLDGYNEYKEPINGDSASSVTQQYGAGRRGFRYMRYTSDGNLFVGRGEAKDNKITNGEKVTFDSNNNVDVYQGYVAANTMSITVHHLDADGNKLADTTTASVTSGTEMSPSDFGTSIKGYAVDKGYLDSGRTTAFSSITYTGSGRSWSSSAAKADNTTDSALHREIWLTYKQQDSLSDLTKVVAHHVDANGNKLADDTVLTVSGTANFDNKWNGFGVFGNNESVGSNFASKKNLGTPTAIYLGNTADTSRQFIYGNNNNQDCIVFKYDEVTKKWYTGIGTTSGTPGPAEEKNYPGLINEITIVYPNSGNNLTVHYLHPVLDGDNKVLMGSDGNPTYRLFSGLADANYPQTISYEKIAEAGDDGIPLNADPTASESTYAKDITESTTEYNYSGSYLASPKTSPAAEKGLPGYARLTTDAPHVRKVRIHNGKYQFLVVSGDGTRTLTMTKRDQWSYTTTGGRTYTLRKSGSTFTMLDSQAGRSTYDLNLTSTTENGNDETVNIYTGKSGAEGVGIEYSVKETKNSTGTSYELTVFEWLDSVQNNIYQVYVKKTDAPVVTVSNEVVYSGNLTARTAGMDGKTIVSYTWEKQINGGKWKEVTRKRTGNNWNIAHDLKGRSWLNLSADEGELSRSGDRTSVKYRVILTYKDSTAEEETKTATSEEFSVPYWDQLENGSFETPSKDSNSKDYLEPTKDGDYSNSAYKSKGVWQTTGPGTGNQADKDIEIINTKTQDGFRGSYGWPQGKTDGAKDGEQFAELNCEASGALYQDVVTKSNEYLNYWLSHRARGGSTRPLANAAPKYDSMYLVIMPTKLAMTSGSDGGELKTQADLQSFIASHAKGGYSSTNPGKEENKVVCRDTNSGVLIVKVSSDNQDWHTISITNGYVAASSLTRFFFVAGYTSSNNPTVGNMLDYVGFSQELPIPETPYFNMVVKKTFSGLTRNEVAKLASNKAADGKAFKLKINEYTKEGDEYTKSDLYYEGESFAEKQNSLNGAELGFTADSSGNFTLTAVGKDPNNTSKTESLFTENGSSTGVVTEDPDTGDITMTWTLYNYYISAGEAKYFRIVEENEDADGYSLSTANNGTLTHAKTVEGATAITTESIKSADGEATEYFPIVDRDTARINYTNDYRNNRDDDPDQIVIRKKFTGITPSVVGNLLGGNTPYTITVKNPDPSGADLKLVGNVQNPVSGNFPEGVTDVGLTYETDTDDGSTTLAWTVKGDPNRDQNWVKTGDYTVKEENYIPGEDNPVSSISINGDPVDLSAKPTSVTKGNLTVGGNAAPVLTPKSGSSVQSVQPGSAVDLTGNSPNLIIAQYKVGENVRYFVWTEETAGVNLRQAIMNLIDGGALNWTNRTAANTGNVNFRSGKNPGTITLKQNEGESTASGSITYDSGTKKLSFANSADMNSGVQWTQYYATAYTIGSTGSAAVEPEIRINNAYEPAIRVFKTDQTSIAKPLSGAEFKLFSYRREAGSEVKKQYFKWNSEDGKPTWVAAPEESDTLTTNKEGFAIHGGTGASALQVISQLGTGTYYLEEIKAPDGYDMPGKPVTAFTVESTGIIKKASDDNIAETEKNNVNQNHLNSIDWNSPYYTLTITNAPGIPLPLTGGKGIWPFILIGLLLIAASGYLLWKRRYAYQGAHVFRGKHLRRG